MVERNANVRECGVYVYEGAGVCGLMDIIPQSHWHHPDITEGYAVFICPDSCWDKLHWRSVNGVLASEFHPKQKWPRCILT